MIDRIWELTVHDKYKNELSIGYVLLHLTKEGTSGSWSEIAAGLTSVLSNFISSIC